MRGRTALCLTILLSVMGAPAVAQEFEAWDGKPLVREGQGGTKQVVEGIDFWDHGDPPRKYKIIGYLHDRRHKSGIIGKISMSHLRSDIAAAAKQAGGDAVIPVSSNTQTTGAVAYSHALGGGVIAGGHAIQQEETDFAVIQYLPADK
jgi:hypothetical protein